MMQTCFSRILLLIIHVAFFTSCQRQEDSAWIFTDNRINASGLFTDTVKVQRAAGGPLIIDTIVEKEVYQVNPNTYQMMSGICRDTLASCMSSSRFIMTIQTNSAIDLFAITSAVPASSIPDSCWFYLPVYIKLGYKWGDGPSARIETHRMRKI